MKNKILLVALHSKNNEQVLTQAKIVLDAGAHGLILVNNDSYLRAKELIELAQIIKKDFPDKKIGINPLERTRMPHEAIALIKGTGLDLLWMDYGGIEEKNGGVGLNRLVEKELKRLDPHTDYYGSIAFKVGPPPKNLHLVTQVASMHFDVVVTSGPTTGEPPTPEKIESIRQSMVISKRCTLAVASGMSAENVRLFLPYADIFIVATSLLKEGNFFTYDPNKVSQFVAAIS